MRMLLKRGFFLVCLLTPLVAHGQKTWVFMPSASVHVVFYKYVPSYPEPPSSRREVLKASLKLDIAELGILNRGCKLGYHRVVLSQYFLSTSVVLDYGVGIARSRRYYFASFSVGPSVFIDTKGVTSGAQGQIRALVMPLRFLGLGISVDYSMPFFPRKNPERDDAGFHNKEVGIGLTVSGRIS